MSFSSATLVVSGPEESTVVKLDAEAVVAEERENMAAIGPYLGENTCSVLAMETAGGRGGLKIQLAVRPF